ncbi:MAG: hypothetical protein H7Y13_01095 [Sphingobacteriaceae bacterium]|nr:hypothetical protein [Sphingobacteriaceae bacterium]
MWNYRRKGICNLVIFAKITNPFPLIENFFQIWNLQECRSLLREVFHQALYSYSHRESINPAEML